MYIVFEKLRYQNFLSTGNVFTEILLNKSPNTLIVGKNGAGKSTILDALMYALYGRAYRKINNPQLVNSITKKNMLVELEFKIGKKKYFIRRGSHPGVYEIYVNGNMLKQDASAKDYQRLFINNHFKLSERSFRQIVVLGSANYMPFMQLTTGHRRDIIEDLLDIQIFTIMNSLLKEKISVNKQAIKDEETSLRILENKRELTLKHIESLRQNNDELIRSKEEKIEEVQKKIEDLLADNDRITIIIQEQNDKIQDQDTVSNKLKQLEEYRRDYQAKLIKFQKEIKFFHEYDDCPTCKQQIDEAFKNEIIDKRESRKSSLEEALEKMRDIESKLSVRAKEIDEANREIMSCNQKIFQNNQSIKHLNQNIRDLQEEIEKLQQNNSTIGEDQTDLRTILLDMKKSTANKEKLIKHQAILDISQALLKDTGIKTRIIKQYIPVMNKLINKYLASMDFFCDFQLDENFNEAIRSRGRDEFSYESFSEGEKARIDLSLLFTWRAISKMRNSVSTNLLILDEVFDSSADALGVESILGIITNEMRDSNIFVISHNEKMYDKFFSCIEFQKVKGFSQIVKR